MMEPTIAQAWLVGLAMVLGTGYAIVRTVFTFDERRLKIQFQTKSKGIDEVTTELAALREELMALRDTSTQYDLSLHQTIERLEQRVNQIETGRPSATVSSSAPEPEHQRLGRG